jgi:hypothetical protein
MAGRGMTPALVAGVDVSTVLVAVVILDASRDGFPLVHVGEHPLAKLPKEGANKATRCRDVSLRIAALGIQARGCRTVYVEQPMGRHVGSVAEVERVVGAFLARLSRGIYAELRGPSAWKADAGLPGNAAKPAIRAEAERHYPILRNRSQDACDAALIARAGCIQSWRAA